MSVLRTRLGDPPFVCVWHRQVHSRFSGCKPWIQKRSTSRRKKASGSEVIGAISLEDIQWDDNDNVLQRSTSVLSLRDSVL